MAAGNRLTSFNGYTLAYDDDGNLVSKTGNGVTQSFEWNAFGQLVSVTTNGSTTTFGYDGLGRRVRQTVNGVTTRSLHDGDQLVVQTDGAGTRQLEFSYYPGIDHPHAVRQSATGTLYYYATSQPGHVTALVDRYDQVVNRYEYAPFGAGVSTTEQVAQPFRFGARELDAQTGLYYHRARYYDPALARFLSEDPIGLAGGVNLYTYAGNDPINQTDPFGLTGCQWTVFHHAVNEHSSETYTELVIDCDLVAPSGFSNNFGNQNARGGRGDNPGRSSAGAQTGRDAARRNMAEQRREEIIARAQWACMNEYVRTNMAETNSYLSSLTGRASMFVANIVLGMMVSPSTSGPALGLARYVGSKVSPRIPAPLNAGAAVTTGAGLRSMLLQGSAQSAATMAASQAGVFVGSHWGMADACRP